MPNPIYCSELSLLISANAAASSGYIRRTDALMRCAGKGDHEFFSQLKSECEAALEECRRTKDAVREHRRTHGC